MNSESVPVIEEDPCVSLKEKYESICKVAELASAPATEDLPAPGLIGQSAEPSVQTGGGYIKLNIDGEDYYLQKKYNTPLNLTGGFFQSQDADIPESVYNMEDMDELLYKKKYEKYRAKYLALKRN